MPDDSLTRLHREDGPLYRQAAARLRARILQGRLEVGDELPTEAQMAAGFGISLITVRHALRELEAEGLVRKRIAKPAVVASAARNGVVRALNNLDDVVAATRDARLEISAYAPRRNPEAAAAFEQKPTTKLPCLRGCLLVRDQPLADITIFFPPTIGARLRREDFDDVVVFRSVERRLGLRFAGARLTVGAEVADARLAQVLNCAPGAAVLVSRMLYLDTTGTPVELTIARHRADRYRLAYEIEAHHPRARASSAAFTQLVRRPSRR